MAKYIEFVGVPGVGKSTTYEFLKTKYEKNSNWIPYEELCKSNAEHRKGIKEFIIAFIIKKIKPGASSKASPDRILLNRAIAAHPELISLFWKTISKVENSKGEELRFYGANYIRAILEKYQRIKEAPSDKYCLVDEGLIHNLNYFTSAGATAGLYEQGSHILSLIELPEAVIYFNGDVNTIVHRTRERRNLRLRDKFLTPSELLRSRRESIQEKQVHMELVKSCKIPVLCLEAKDSVKVKANRIISFVKELG